MTTGILTFLSEQNEKIPKDQIDPEISHSLICKYWTSNTAEQAAIRQVIVSIRLSVSKTKLEMPFLSWRHGNCNMFTMFRSINR